MFTQQTLEYPERHSNMKLDFVIVGERRCGTTTLYHLLKAHPDIVMPEKSDINYFLESEIANSRTPVLDVFTEDEYWKNHSIDELQEILPADEGKCVGFKAPDTFYYAKAHDRLKKLAPAATKYIIILREPTERALSHYWLDRSKGRETLKPDEAFAKEETRMSESDYAKAHFSYRDRGFYAKSLRKWYETFSPESTLVVILDELKRNPHHEWECIQRFLCVNSVPYAAVPKSNQNVAMIVKSQFRKLESILKHYESWVFRLTAKIELSNEQKAVWRTKLRAPFFKKATNYTENPELRERLKNEYESCVEELESFLDKDLSSWK